MKFSNKQMIRRLIEIRGTWQYFGPDKIRGIFFHSWPATYAIYIDGKLMYIGQTRNMAKRSLQHIYEKEPGGRIHTRFGSSENVEMKVKYSHKEGQEKVLEKKLIRKIVPPMNRMIYA